MSQSDHPLNSKEFKIILKSGNFKDIIEGKENVINTIKLQIQKQGGTFDDTDQDEDHRNVLYLDTENHVLYNEKKFFLRIRAQFKKNGDLKEYEVNLKNREEDGHKALKYDLSPQIENNLNYKNFEFKFEEDIIIPFRSKFSASTNFESEQQPKLETWQDILNIFSNLDLGIQSDEGLLLVNRFIAKEFSYKLGIIKFKDENIAETGISLWYKMPSTEESMEDNDFSLDSIKNKTPLIVEFDIDIKAKKSSSDNGTVFHEFPSSLLEETEMFFRSMALRKEDMADLCATKTKTQFVYEAIE